MRKSSPAESAAKFSPHSVEAEQSVLGSMMLDRTPALQGMELLSGGDFYRPVHTTIFNALGELVTRSEPIDLITLQEKLRADGALEDAGGTEYLMACMDRVPTAANLKHYAGIVIELATRRRAIVAGMEIMAIAQDTENDPSAVTDCLMNHALNLTAGKGVELRDGMAVVTAAWDRMQGYRDGRPKRGIPWGLSHIDALTYGVCPGDFVLVAGRPSHGKTVMLCQLFTQAVLSGHVPVYYSQEMSAEDLGERILCAKARIDGGLIRAGQGDEVEWGRLSTAVADLSGKWFVRDLPASEAQIVASARRAQLQHGADLILVDYIQLVQCSVRRENRNLELQHIADTFQRLSRQTGMAVVAAAQLSRASQKRADPRPRLDDMRESGSLEQNADKVILIHNPDYKKTEAYNDGSLPKCKALLDAAKHRNGPTGEAVVWFTPAATRFDDCADLQWIEPASPEGKRKNAW